MTTPEATKPVANPEKQKFREILPFSGEFRTEAQIASKASQVAEATLKTLRDKVEKHNHQLEAYIGDQIILGSDSVFIQTDEEFIFQRATDIFRAIAVKGNFLGLDVFDTDGVANGRHENYFNSEVFSRYLVTLMIREAGSDRLIHVPIDRLEGPIHSAEDD